MNRWTVYTGLDELGRMNFIDFSALAYAVEIVVFMFLAIGVVTFVCSKVFYSDY